MLECRKTGKTALTSNNGRSFGRTIGHNDVFMKMNLALVPTMVKRCHKFN